MFSWIKEVRSGSGMHDPVHLFSWICENAFITQLRDLNTKVSLMKKFLTCYSALQYPNPQCFPQTCSLDNFQLLHIGIQLTKAAVFHSEFGLFISQPQSSSGNRIIRQVWNQILPLPPINKAFSLFWHFKASYLFYHGLIDSTQYIPPGLAALWHKMSVRQRWKRLATLKEKELR